MYAFSAANFMFDTLCSQLQDVGLARIITGISVVGLSFLAWSLRPPPEIRKIPSISFFKFMWYLVCQKTREEIHNDLMAPLLRNHNAVKVWYLGAWIVLFSEPEAAKAIFLDTATFQKYNIGERMKGTIDYDFFGNSFLFKNGDEWRKQRQIVNPAFHRSWSTESIGIVIRDLVDYLDQGKGKPVEIVTLMHRAALDVLGRIAFDFDFGAVRDPTNPYYRLYSDIMDIIRFPIRSFFPQLDRLPLPYVKRGIRKLKEFDEIIYKMVDRKQREARERKRLGTPLTAEQRAKADLLTLMVEAKIQGGDKGSTEKEFRDNLILFYIGGHDTTSNSLSFILMELALNPEVQAKARKEALEVLGDDPTDVVPTTEQLKQLPYIGSIIKENQRKNPVITMVTREVAKPTVVSGCQLKPGIVAGVYIYGIHHNHRCYPDPETFDPDRFGPEDGNASDKDHGQRRTRMPFSWIPFIAGSRQCMGMNFSLIEQHVFLSMLLRKFEWTLPADSPFWKHTATGSFEISYPRDLNIVFTPRY